MAFLSKVSFFFQDTSGYGWSENQHYYASDGILHIDDFQNYANLRRAFLPQDVGLNYVRATTSVPRSVLFDTYNNNPGTPNGLYGVNSDPDFAALKFQLQSAISTGHVFIRTLPTDCVTEDGYTPAAAFRAALTNWANNLLAFQTNGNFWALRTALTGTPAPTYHPSNLSPTPPRGFQAQVSTGAWAKGDTVRISGAKVYGYNGLKVVNNVIVGAPLDTVFFGGAAPGNFEPNANLISGRKEIFTSSQIVNYIPEGLTRRSPGRFFGQRRGRSSTKNSLRQ